MTSPSEGSAHAEDFAASNERIRREIIARLNRAEVLDERLRKIEGVLKKHEDHIHRCQDCGLLDQVRVIVFGADA